MRQDIFQKVGHDDTDLFQVLAVRGLIESRNGQRGQSNKTFLNQISLSKNDHGHGTES